MEWRIGRVICIQQVERCSPDLCLPRAYPNAITGEGELNANPFTVFVAHRNDWQESGIVVGIERALCSVRIQHLTKISLLVKQAHAYHRNAQVTSGLKLISRHVTQTTRIDWQGFAQHELHAEVSDTTQWRFSIILLKPGRRLNVVLFCARSLVNLTAIIRVLHQGLQSRE